MRRCVYGGNPHLFPIRIMKASSRFYVPLKNATFAFQPDWPALTGLNIDLNFIQQRPVDAGG